MSSKFRLVSVFLAATLTAITGCSMVALEVNANGPTVSLTSRHVSGSSSNLGTITYDATTYALPSTFATSYDTFDIRFNPASGTYFIRWELEIVPDTGPPSSYIYDPNSQTTKLHVDSSLTLRAVYGGNPVVGGVVLPTNSLTVLVPYLAVIGLVATAAVAVKKRRN